MTPIRLWCQPPPGPIITAILTNPLGALTGWPTPPYAGGSHSPLGSTMPRSKTDLSDQIEAIIREATAHIVALVEGEREAMLESLQRAMTALDSSLKNRPGLPEALRAAVPTSALRPTPAKRPPRDQWIRTADVVVRLRELLAERRDGARIAELREATQFSDMQLHRALRQLRDKGEVTKEGELRRTVYRYIDRKRPAPARRRAAAKKKATTKRRGAQKKKVAGRRKSVAPSSPPKRRASPRPPARPPRSQWVSTDDVKRAARKALRRKSKGLRMSDLCTATGYSDKQLYRAIVALVDEGVVKRVGKLRNMRYVLA